MTLAVASRLGPYEMIRKRPVTSRSVTSHCQVDVAGSTVSRSSEPLRDELLRLGQYTSRLNV
jgi:hypothetical protein